MGFVGVILQVNCFNLVSLIKLSELHLEEYSYKTQTKLNVLLEDCQISYEALVPETGLGLLLNCSLTTFNMHSVIK